MARARITPCEKKAHKLLTPDGELFGHQVAGARDAHNGSDGGHGQSTRDGVLIKINNRLLINYSAITNTFAGHFLLARAPFNVQRSAKSDYLQTE